MKNTEEQVAAPSEDTIKFEKEDLLVFSYLSEKKRRLDAENERVQVELFAFQQENTQYTQSLSTKYNVDLSTYTLDMATGTARPSNE